MAAIFLMTFWNEFFKQMYEFRLNFLLKFVPKGAINNVPALV